MPCNKSFELFSQDELHQIEKIMLPGELSESGFLKEGDSLLKIYQDDKDYLDKVGITYDQIADILEYYNKKASRLEYLRWANGGNFFEPVEYNNFKILRTTWMGAQTCPFQESSDEKYYGYQYGDTDVTILNLTTNKSITYNTLLPHMIRYHHFFESPNVSHRVNPKDVIDFFDLKPGIDYSPIYAEEKYWKHIYSSTLISKDEIKNMDILKKMSITELNPHNDVSIFLVPFDINDIKRDAEMNLDENDNYESIRRKILESKNKYNKKHHANDRSPNSLFAIHTENEISQKIKNELELLLEFKKNGTLETSACKMIIYCLSNSSYDVKVDVGGIKYEITRGYSVNHIRVNRYINN